jgi:hypothetical protein
MDARAKQKRRMLTYPQIIELGKRLEAVCSKGADGFAHYEGDYSDAELARELDCSLVSVARLRFKTMGRLRVASNPNAKQEAANHQALRLARLESQVTALTVWAMSRSTQPFSRDFGPAKWLFEKEV